MNAVKRRITKRVVDTLEQGQIVWDSNVKGFGIRCQKKAKVYVLKSRVQGRQRWFTIGQHGSPWTPEKARTEALAILGDIAHNKNPVMERERRKGTLTVKDVADRFLTEHVEAKLKEKTVKGYKDQFERLILPKIGKLDIGTIDRADIAKLHHSLRDTPYQANRVLAVLSKMFTWVEKRGLRPDNTNPCRHVEKYAEKARERFLSAAEISRLADSIVEMGQNEKINPFAAAAIRLLMLTGARVGEILSLKWEHVDFEQSGLFLEDSKTGKKIIWLSAPAKQLLADLPRIEGNPYVIAGGKDRQPLVNLKDPWRALRKRADLEGVRMHDLRHSFASFAAAGGLSLPLIGKLLGHTQAATTERYAHIADDPVKAATEAVGNRIAAAMKGQKGEVISLKKKRG